MKRRSEKKYGVAVILSGIFGILGVQHFYLGRWGLGLTDVALSFLALYFFLNGEPVLALIFLGLDYLHTLVTTILLLTGSFRDGTGAYVTYPNQKLD